MNNPEEYVSEPASAIDEIKSDESLGRGESPYVDFQTDSAAETQGIRLEYGNYYVTIARAGGANKNFKKVLEVESRPYRRRIETETMSLDLAEDLLRKVYSQSVIIGWGSKRHGDGKMVGPAGEAIPFTRENVYQVLADIPELYEDIRDAATKAATFRVVGVEEDAKN